MSNPGRGIKNNNTHGDSNYWVVKMKTRTTELLSCID
jgi:hypothetical protein